MALILHIIIALSSLVFTTFVFFSPSKQRLNISYALVATTLITGTYLVVSMKAQILRACLTGLVYLAVVAFGIIAARHKLAAQNN